MTGQAARGRALVVGKFLPPHAGHHALVRFAEERFDEVAVVVCDFDGQRPGAVERARWMALVHPEVHVEVVADICGWHSPEPCPPACSAKWARHLEAMGLGPWDAVVSSESYGPAFAAELDAEHVAFDPDRSAVPISGTAVRDDLAGAWPWLHPVVRAGLARRLVVVGAESTGTSTLARDLAVQLGAPHVTEYGRDHSALLAERAGSIADVVWTERDFELIADGQEARAADALASWAEGSEATFGEKGPWVVCDTDLLATAVWHERYLGEPAPWLVERALREDVRPDLYVLTSPAGVPFEQDGLRDGEHLREWMHERFREVLAESGVEWIEVAGTREERIATVLGQLPELDTGVG